jgi:hypothetical protein
MSRLSANDERLPLIQGKQGRYYLVDGCKYDEHFPQEWAQNPLEYPECDEDGGPICCSDERLTGPKYCGNCREYGSINGVFVFYCANCYKFLYKGSRGGFIYAAIDATEKELWEEMPYMNGVKFDEIGDIDIPTKWSEPEDGDIAEEYYDTMFHRIKKRESKKRKEQMRESSQPALDLKQDESDSSGGGEYTDPILDLVSESTSGSDEPLESDDPLESDEPLESESTSSESSDDPLESESTSESSDEPLESDEPLTLYDSLGWDETSRSDKPFGSDKPLGTDFPTKFEYELITIASMLTVMYIVICCIL